MIYEIYDPGCLSIVTCLLACYACFVFYCLHCNRSFQLIIFVFDAGVITVLKYPYPNIVKEPEQYDCIRVHAHMGKHSSVHSKPLLSVSYIVLIAY